MNLFDFSALSPTEKMDLADALYDSAQQAMEASSLPLTAEQRAEVSRRSEAVASGNLATEEWTVVYNRLVQSE